MATVYDLIGFWKEFLADPKIKGQYVHPRDREVLTPAPRPNEQSDFEYLTTNGLKAELLPGPYQGDLENAKIFVLMVNPGVGLDSLREQKDKQYLCAMKKQIAQDFRQTEFKFLNLDPEFCWTGGFRWWFRKFGGLIHHLKEKRSIELKQALRQVANNVASLELFAYPSSHFRHHRHIKLRHYSKPNPALLPSTVAIRNFANALARDRTKHLIIARQNSGWGIKIDEKLRNFSLEKGQSRGAWFVNERNISDLAELIPNDL